MNRSAAACGVAAFALVLGGVALPLACIPDLPADHASPDASDRCGDGVIDLALGEECDPGPGTADAGAGGCSSACRMLCDGGFVWPRNDHCYRLVGAGAPALRATNGSADGVCQQHGGHVVTFASEEEFQAVTTALDAGIFWVGLSPARNAAGAAIYEPIEPSLFEPGWSPGCPGCFAHTDDASAPLPVFPGVSLEAGSLGCVVSSNDGVQSWRQYPCTVQGIGRRRLELPQVICEQEPVGRRATPCEAGACFELVATRGTKQYVYEGAQAPADVARSACAGVGGRLVVLQSAEEREQLWRELSLQTVQPYGVWIGLSDPNAV
ncbi:MAG: hypothetical protein JOZ69_20275, partial [Myxococcales bacterium]|nr:hypothetical protein [Myxococcales bacterium]